MKYYLCVIREGKNFIDESSNEVYPTIGSIYVSKNDEYPECAEENDKWIEISKEQYDKFCEDANYPIKYDGIHCVGTCYECKKCFEIKNIKRKPHVKCEVYQDFEKIDPETYKSCCIID